MCWSQQVQSVRCAHLRAAHAETDRRWHIAVQNYLFCYDEAASAGDERAMRFFAAKLERSYTAMQMRAKAGYWAMLAD